MALKSQTSIIASYVKELSGAVTTLDWTVTPLIVAALQKAARIYVCGNGGSAANAGHLVLHLQEMRLRAQNMFADMAYVTAVSNDRSFETAQRNYLRFAASPEDVLMVISGSGDSANIILALTEARRLGMRTIGLLGMGGGGALSLCNLACVVASDDYGVVEDAHSAIVHVLKKLLAATGGGSQLQRLKADVADAGANTHRRKRPHAAGTRAAAAGGGGPEDTGVLGAEGRHEQAEAAASGGES